MKRTHTDLIGNTEGMDIYSISYVLTKELIAQIKVAAGILRDNFVLISVTIDGDALSSSVRQYDSTIDDEERKGVSSGNFTYFKTNVHSIIVSCDGSVRFRAYSKWDDAMFYEVELEVE